MPFTPYPLDYEDNPRISDTSCGGDPTAVEVTLEHASTKASANSIPRRVILLNPANNWSMSVGRASSSVGQTEAVDNAYFSSKVVSRNHAIVSATPSNKMVYVTDVSSMHGTHLDGRRLPAQERQPVSDGDILTFGSQIDRGEVSFYPIEVQMSTSWQNGRRRLRAYELPPSTPSSGQVQRTTHESDFSDGGSEYSAVDSDDEGQSDDAVHADVTVEKVPSNIDPPRRFTVPESDFSEDNESLFSEDDVQDPDVGRSGASGSISTDIGADEDPSDVQVGKEAPADIIVFTPTSPAPVSIAQPNHSDMVVESTDAQLYDEREDHYCSGDAQSEVQSEIEEEGSNSGDVDEDAEETEKWRIMEGDLDRGVAIPASRPLSQGYAHQISPPNATLARAPVPQPTPGYDLAYPGYGSSTQVPMTAPWSTHSLPSHMQPQPPTYFSGHRPNTSFSSPNALSTGCNYGWTGNDEALNYLPPGPEFDPPNGTSGHAYAPLMPTTAREMSHISSYAHVANDENRHSPNNIDSNVRSIERDVGSSPHASGSAINPLKRKVRALSEEMDDSMEALQERDLASSEDSVEIRTPEPGDSPRVVVAGSEASEQRAAKRQKLEHESPGSGILSRCMTFLSYAATGVGGVAVGVVGTVVGLNMLPEDYFPGP